MHITFSPQRRDNTLSVTKSGDILTINGEAFDFTGLPDGATIEGMPCQWIVGPVERIDGELCLTLIMPHGPNPSQSVAFPEPIINPPDGAIALPTEEPAHVDG